MPQQNTLPHSSSVADLGVKSQLDALLATIGPVAGLRVIDIGCGEGGLTRALAKLGAQVAGYDPFISGTALTALGAGSFRLTKAPADAIPEPDHAADLVLYVFSLHHVPAKGLRRLSPKRGGCCDRRASSTWRSLWHKARIHTSWSCSTMKRRCEKLRPMRLLALPVRTSPRNKILTYTDVRTFPTLIVLQKA